MPRFDIYNYDMTTVIAVVCQQPLGNSRDDRRSKRIVEIADEVACRQLNLGCIVIDAADPGRSGEVSR